MIIIDTHRLYIHAACQQVHNVPAGQKLKNTLHVTAEDKSQETAVNVTVAVKLDDVSWCRAEDELRSVTVQKSTSSSSHRNQVLERRGPHVVTAGE